MESSQKQAKSTAITMDDLDEGILVEILTRLQLKPLFRCKLVSKQWKSIISDPKLRGNYYKRSLTSTASYSKLHLTPKPIKYGTPKPILLTDQANDQPRAPFGAFVVPCTARINEQERVVLASSQGLVLSSSYTHRGTNVITRVQLYVSNPLTKKSVQLPYLRGPFQSSIFGLVTRPVQESVTYKVMLIQDVIGSSLCEFDVRIFSSDTGRWADPRVLACPCSFRVGTRTNFGVAAEAKAFTCNGILHWFDEDTRTMVTYDPYDRPGSFGQIVLPGGGGSGMNLIRLGHENLVEYCEIDDDRTSLVVWCLVDYDKGEWWMVQRLIISPSTNVLPSQPVVVRRMLSCLLRENVIVDLESAAEELSSPCEPGMAVAVPLELMNLLVHVVLCPLSSPFYVQN